jgi:hypothetical protein
MWKFFTVDCRQAPSSYVWKQLGEEGSKLEWTQRFRKLAGDTCDERGRYNELAGSCADPERGETQEGALRRLYDLCHANKGMHKTTPSRSSYRQHYDVDWEAVAPGCMWWS